MPSSTAYHAWWWSNVLSNDLDVLSVGLSVSVGAVDVAHSHHVPPQVRVRRQRFLPAASWRTHGSPFGTPLVLARALVSDVAELPWP